MALELRDLELGAQRSCYAPTQVSVPATNLTKLSQAGGEGEGAERLGMPASSPGC